MRKQAYILDKVGGKLVDAYQRRTGIGREAIEAWMDEETWFTSDEAVEAGLVDEVIEETAAAAFVVPATMGFKHPPTAPVQPKQRAAGRLAALQRQLDLARMGA
jgi:ATP-dependent Clp protease protease subunit